MAPPRGDDALPPPWGFHPLDEGTVDSLRLGPRQIWFQRSGTEVLAAGVDGYKGGVDPRVDGDVGESTDGPPESGGWSRWATAGEDGEIFIRPAFPDRPLVLSPERPFRLLPRARARVFVRVPLWIHIELRSGRARGEGDEERAILLTSVPSVTMSDTWWGDVEEGELAYWLPTTARSKMAPELFAPHLAVCPLHLENEADIDLEVERIAFRVNHLTLFAKGSELWADESRVSYQGDEEASHIEMTGKPPVEAKGARLVAGPREPVLRGLRARTFARFRSFPGLGGGV